MFKRFGTVFAVIAMMLAMTAAPAMAGTSSRSYHFNNGCRTTQWQGEFSAYRAAPAKIEAKTTSNVRWRNQRTCNFVQSRVYHSSGSYNTSGKAYGTSVTATARRTGTNEIHYTRHWGAGLGSSYASYVSYWSL